MMYMGFASLASDECAFRREFVWLIFYLEDIIEMGMYQSDFSAVKELRTYLDKEDPGPLR